MFENLKKYVDLIPKLIPLIYILGFIVIAGYFSNFGYSDFNILNIIYLKAGILIFFIFTINLSIFYFITQNTQTTITNTNLSRISLIIIRAFIFTTMIIIFSLSIINFSDLSKIPTIPYYLGIACLIILLIINLIPENIINTNLIGKILLIEIILLTVLVILGLIYLPLAIHVLLFNLMLWFTISILMDHFTISNISSKFKNIIGDIFLIIGTCFYFGAILYDKIPPQYGGGKPYHISIINENIPNKKSSDNFANTYAVLYENNDIYLLSDEKTKKVISIKKSNINIVDIIK